MARMEGMSTNEYDSRLHGLIENLKKQKRNRNEAAKTNALDIRKMFGL